MDRTCLKEEDLSPPSPSPSPSLSLSLFLSFSGGLLDEGPEDMPDGKTSSGGVRQEPGGLRTISTRRPPELSGSPLSISLSLSRYSGQGPLLSLSLYLSAGTLAKV